MLGFYLLSRSGSERDAPLAGTSMNASYYGIAFSCRRRMLPAWTVRFSRHLPSYFSVPRRHPERAWLRLPLPMKRTVASLSLDEVAEALAGTSGGATPDPRQWEAVHAMVRQGVPNHMRAKLWPVRSSLRLGGTAALPPSKSRRPSTRERRCLIDETSTSKALLGPTRV